MNVDQIHPALGGYLEAMAAAHCPRLAEALACQQVLYSVHQAEPFGVSGVFAALVDVAEEVRTRRRAHGDLACAVLAVLGPQDEDAAHWVMDVPHWLAVNLYSHVGLAFGSAAVEECYEEDDDPVPVSFFYVRPWTAAEVAAFGAGMSVTPVVTDDGRDVLEPIIGRSASGAAARAGFRRLVLELRRKA